MKAETRSLLMLVSTLVLGVLLGAVGNGAMARERRARVEEMKRPGGFVEHMEEIIRPRDDAQRAAIEPVIRATGDRNRAIIHAANEQLRAALDSMRARLAPELDAEQRRRLDDFARTAPPLRPGGRPGHRRGERPPPHGPGERPPPPP
jgi:hypothetical protein